MADMEQEEGTALRDGAAASSDIRFMIRTGSMDLTVPDTRETVKQVRERVSAAGGLISSSHVYEIREERYTARLTLRVPVERFDAVMEQLQELGKADNVHHSDDEVTSQYIEMEARIKNLKAQEERYREILEMAEDVEDVLKIERELVRIRGDIEVMTTQFTRLQDQVTYSTINLVINEETIATETLSPAPFENLGSRMKTTLLRSINFILAALAGFLVFLSGALPVLVILALIASLFWLVITRIVRRRPPAA